MVAGVGGGGQRAAPGYTFENAFELTKFFYKMTLVWAAGVIFFPLLVFFVRPK